MNKETILDYATKTPENTNRNVLSSMLDSFSKSSGGAVRLYFVDQPASDPWLLKEFPNFTFVPFDEGRGFALEPDGVALTIEELITLIKSGPVLTAVEVDEEEGRIWRAKSDVLSLSYNVNITGESNIEVGVFVMGFNVEQSYGFAGQTIPPGGDDSSGGVK